MATSRQGMGSFMTDDHEDLKDQCMNDPFWAADEIERLRGDLSFWVGVSNGRKRADAEKLSEGKTNE